MSSARTNSHADDVLDNLMQMIKEAFGGSAAAVWKKAQEMSMEDFVKQFETYMDSPAKAPVKRLTKTAASKEEGESGTASGWAKKATSAKEVKTEVATPEFNWADDDDVPQQPAPTKTYVAAKKPTETKAMAAESSTATTEAPKVSRWKKPTSA